MPPVGLKLNNHVITDDSPVTFGANGQNAHRDNADAESGESLVDLFNEVCRNPESRQRTVLRDYVGAGHTMRREWTLGELDVVTERLARVFIRHYGVERGSCVAIYMNKRAEYVFAYMAALRSGCAYLPLDISYPESLLNSVLDEVRPAVICTTVDHAGRLPAGTNVLVFDEEGEWLRKLEREEELNAVSLPECITGSDLAYIVYSSGTTGKPKGIACPHRGAVISYRYRFAEYPYERDDVVACNVFFVWELFRPILCATTMVVVPDDVIYDPTRLCQFLLANRVTRMLFTPSLLETLFDTQRKEALHESFQYFRIIHLCGEVVTCALLNRFMKSFPRIRCINLYSISETHDVAVADLNAFHARNEQRQYAPVGRVLPQVKVLIMDASLKRVPIGVAGEIYVAGPTLAIGYINRLELNRNRFVDVPAEYRAEVGGGRKMYRTGDWGYLLPNSVLEICGRCDTLVRIRGYGIELQAIESTLLKLAYVRSCAVVSIGAEGEDKQLAAYIVLRENVTRKTLRADLKRRLPFYMVPQFFVFMDKLPVLAASSKIDKKALPAVDRAGDIVETEALPHTPTERRLAQIWSQVLQHSTLDIQESFFDLGGHSLLAARLLARVGEEFGVELSMRDLFSAPTVHAMACRLDGSERTSPEQMLDLDGQVETHDVKDNVMDLHLRAFWRSTEWDNRFYRSNILLTGVTGFLGCHILEQLLSHSQAQIICMVRKVSTESVEDRVESALKERGLLTSTVATALKERVRVISADVALVQFGLSEEHYHYLTYDVDVVIHAAAYVNLIYPYQALHGINVLGTRNVLDFCLKNKIKPLHYISTDAVIPHGLADVDENFDAGTVKEKLADGYGQSKYVAEQLVLRSQSRGLPSIVYRLGNQAPEAAAGHWNEQDFTYLMLKAVLQLGEYPDIDFTVELTPVDFTSRFIAELSTTCFCANVGKLFHLVNSADSPRWLELMEWLRRSGYALEKVPFVDWLEAVTSSKAESLQQFQKLAAVMVRTEQFFLHQSSFRRTNTDRVLESHFRRAYPRVDEHLIKHWTRLLVERQIIAPPNLLPGSNALAGKVCIVTGASEGIGEAIARVLAADGGASVVIAARQVDKLRKLVAKCQKIFGVSESRLMAAACDVTDAEQVRRLVADTIAHFGRVDVLVNCAGCMYYCMTKNGYTEEWRRQIDVNCHGTTNMIGAVVPHMVERRSGHILSITSDAGKRGFAGLAVYSGSKFYIEGLTQALRQELVEYGIRVTNIQPGDVATKLAARSTDSEARKLYDFSAAGHKILSPDDVAQSVLFALSQPPHVALNEILIEPQAAPI